MAVILSHRIALDPTAKQEVLLRQAVGVARFAYNWLDGVEAPIGGRGKA